MLNSDDEDHAVVQQVPEYNFDDMDEYRQSHNPTPIKKKNKRASKT